MASNQGLASDKMDANTKHKIQSAGGHASGGNFANDKERASDAGKKGAAAQSTQAKAKGGHNADH